MFRHPKTTNEKRQDALLRCERFEIERVAPLTVRLRSGRSGYGLPDTYDDLCRARRGRSWKGHRKTPYRTR